MAVFYKMLNRLTSLYLQSLILRTVNARSSYKLRNVNDITTIHAQTNQYINSFLPTTVRHGIVSIKRLEIFRMSHISDLPQTNIHNCATIRLCW